LPQLFPVLVLAALALMLWQSLAWTAAARTVPLAVGSVTLVFGAISLVYAVCGRAAPIDGASRKLHMDLASDTGHLAPATLVTRAAVFFGWLAAFMASMSVIGVIPTIPLFVVGFMRLENREPWRIVLPQAIGLTAFVWFVFDYLLNLAWPETWLGTAWPLFKAVPSL
jgi:hypothetical protein